MEVEEDAPIVELADLLESKLNPDEILDSSDEEGVEKLPILPHVGKAKDEPLQVFTDKDLSDLL